MTKANKELNLDNVSDVLSLNKYSLELHSIFGVDEKRFIFLIRKIGKRLKRDMGDGGLLPDVLRIILTMIKADDLNDPEAFLVIAHTFLNIGFGRGKDWQFEENSTIVNDALLRLGLGWLLPREDNENV